jgi:hypothetical protein
MDTFTAQDMHDYASYTSNPDFYPKKSLAGWCIDRSKPTKKVIDLSALIDSIDCEFSDDGDVWATSQLSCLICSGAYVDRTKHAWKYCKPRMNHIHAIAVDSLKEAGIIRVKLSKAGFVFSFDILNYISGYVLLIWGFGVADGYVMPWEGE